MRDVTITVGDMACSGCAGNVERALRKVEGVEEVDVSLDPKEARVRAGDEVSDEELVLAVRKAGYTPEL